MKKYNDLLNDMIISMGSEPEKYSINNWEYARERVYPVPVSADAPELLQEAIICREHEDGKVLYRFSTGLMPGTGFSHEVTKSMLDTWGISEAELDAAAMKNLSRGADGD